MLSARHCYRHWAYGSEKGGKLLSVRQAKNMVSRRVRREPWRLKQSEGGGKKAPRLEAKWEPHGEAF